MTAEGSIDYDALSQDAMRGVVRNVLTRTAKVGLPGEHHFYISFDTLAPGVVLSKRLREKYPGEMTIVLQHRFWDLIVTDERFEVKLTFDGIPERLVIPFGSIKVFYDPSVRFGLQFELGAPLVDSADDEKDVPVSSRPIPLPTPLAAPPTLTAIPSSRPSSTATPTGEPGDRDDRAGLASRKTLDGRGEAAEGGNPDSAASADGASAGAQVVSLDHFRKK